MTVPTKAPVCWDGASVSRDGLATTAPPVSTWVPFTSSFNINIITCTVIENVLICNMFSME